MNNQPQSLISFGEKFNRVSCKKTSVKLEKMS